MTPPSSVRWTVPTPSAGSRTRSPPGLTSSFSTDVTRWSWKDRPFEVDPSHLPDFQGDPTLVQASGGLEGGQFVDYHRVGDSHMIVVMRRNGPWPLSWLSNLR